MEVIQCLPEKTDGNVEKLKNELRLRALLMLLCSILISASRTVSDCTSLENPAFLVLHSLIL